ncbi:MAG: hypothetical protein Q4C86_04330 [bacterium]|nr:hypothetical protein [bacterium]
MLFSDKLIFLLNVTTTTNAQLARAINVDPSMISRLRSGRRGLPHDDSYVEAMAGYFSKQFTKQYQRSALGDALGQDGLSLPEQPHLLSVIIYEWMKAAGYDADSKAGVLLKTFDHLSLSHYKENAETAAPDSAEWDSSELFIYYGNEGKRKAVLAFLDRILQCESHCTVRITSDESYEWIVEAPAFAAKLAQAIAALRDRGHRCQRIAASVSDINYSFDSITRWLPLMASGMLESFYYPRMRDGVYHRTMLVAPNVAALVSTSVGTQRESGATFLTLEKATVECYAREFADYFSMCKPMTKTYSGAQMSDMLLLRALGYENAFANCIQKSGSLSLITMPPALVDGILAKAESPSAQKLLRQLKDDSWHFEDIVSRYKIIDIFPLAAVEEIAAGKVPIAASQILCGRACYYSPQEYQAHLQNVIALLKKYRNYHLVPDDGGHICSNIIYIREGAQALLCKDADPVSIIEITENNMVSALWEYIMRGIEPRLSPAAVKPAVIKQLEKLVRNIDRYLEQKRQS